MVDYLGTDFDEVITGTSDDDVVDARLGSDTIDTGDGDDVIIDSGGLRNVINAGRGNDTILFADGLYSSSTRGVLVHSQINAGEGDDYVTIDHAGFGFGTMAIDLGAGADVLRIGFDTYWFRGDTTITTGTGSDIIQLGFSFGFNVGLSNFYYPLPEMLASGERDHSAALVIADFSAGAGGDVIDLGEFLVGLFDREGLPFWSTSFNPFTRGQIYLVQDGADTLVNVDTDGAPHGGDSVYFEGNIMRLTGVDMADLTAYNFAGLDPLGADLEPTTARGTAQNDVFRATVPKATFNGQAGDDLLVGNVGNDSLTGGSGADEIHGGYGHDTLRGQAGDDTLIGGFGSDQIEGGDGNDLIIDEAGSDTLIGGAGDDILILDRPYHGKSEGDGYFEWITIDTGTGNDQVFYTEVRVSNSSVPTQNSSEVSADLGEGDDVFVFASPRAALSITTGAGTDRLMALGDLRANIISFTVDDFTPGDGEGDGGDILYLGSIIKFIGTENPFATGDLILAQQGADVIVSWDYDGSGPGDYLIEIAQLVGVSVADLTAFNFAGWDPLKTAPIATTVTGTAANDRLYGDAAGNTMLGLGGDDQLYGEHGDDDISGGDGNDLLSAGWGNDRLDGGAGDDRLESLGEGSATLIGGSGDDEIIVYHSYVYRNETIDIDAGDGNDYVSVTVGESGGARSAITIDLGAGDDRYYVGGTPRGGLELTLGSGRDVIEFSIFVASSGDDGFVVTDFETGAEGDILDLSFFLPSRAFHRPFGGYYTHDGTEFYNPFVFGDAGLYQIGDDVHLKVGGSIAQPTTIVLQNINLFDLTNENFGIELALDTYTGTDQGNVVAGTSGRDVMRGNGGADELSGLAGDDLLYGGAGDDLLDGGSGFNFIDGGDGDDTITAGDGGNVVRTGTGTNSVTLGSGDDIVVSDGRDAIDTGAGDDKVMAEDLSGDGVTPPTDITTGVGNDEVWLRDGSFTVDLGSGNDELHTETRGNVLAKLGPGADVVYFENQWGVLRISDFEAGDDGDRIVIDVPTVSRDPFLTGEVEIKQIGNDVHLRFYDWSTSIVIIENTLKENITAFNLNASSIDTSIVSDAMYIDDAYTNPIGSVLSSINPVQAEYSSVGSFILFAPRDASHVLTNDGRIEVSNALPSFVGRAFGINMSSSTEEGLIRNGASGEIIINANEVSAVGIDSAGGISVINDGLIEVNWVGNGTASQIAGVIYGSYGVYERDPTDRLTNNGDIVVTSQDFATGVRLDNGGALTNTGTISVFAENDAIGIDAQFGLWGTPIINSGEIVVTAGDDAQYLTVGILIEALSGFSAILDRQTIVNSGLIKADLAVWVYYESDYDGIAQTIDNSGTIDGLVILDGGDDIVINSGSMNTRLLLGTGDDVYRGAVGTHSGTIEGGIGDDLLIGGYGRERLFGDQGDDTIVGGGGDDFIEGGHGNNLLDGGAGFDSVFYGASNGAIVADLATGSVIIALNEDLVRNFEEFIGSMFGDTILGSRHSEFLLGNAGADVIDGRGGDDLIVGGKGNDTLTGGQGADVFLFDIGDGQDVITDFSIRDGIDIYGYSQAESITQIGADVRLVLSATDAIVVRNAVVADLTNGSVYYDPNPAQLDFPSINPQPFALINNLQVEQGAVFEQIDPTSIDDNGSFQPAAYASVVKGLVPQSFNNPSVENSGTVSLVTSNYTVWSSAIERVDQVVNTETGVIQVDAASASFASGVRQFQSFFNYGTLLVNNNRGDAAGVSVVEKLVVNTGTIDVSAAGRAGGISHATTFSTYDQVFNTGTITVHGAGQSTGIAFDMLGHPLSGEPVIVNSGDITVTDETGGMDSAGLFLDVSSRAIVWNSGTISADYSIFVITRSVSSLSTDNLTVYNSGDLLGDIKTTSYGDTVVNEGLIVGSVELQGGDDLFDGRGGELTGAVDGGNGNDVLLTGVGAQTLSGGLGEDVLSGGAGTDILIGGEGSDSFRFGTGFGHDEITDFGFGGVADTVNIFGYTAYQSIVQVGNDVLVTFSATDKLTVREVQVADLTAGAIQFGAPDIAANVIAEAPAAPSPATVEFFSAPDTGLTFPDTIGTDHSDILIGGIGLDKMFGQGGADWLFGGGDSDTFTGGTGYDFFAFDISNNNSADTITDYRPDDKVLFAGNAIPPTVTVSGADVLVNGVRLTGAAWGNVTTIVQASTAVLGATAQQLGNVLTSNTALSNGALAGIGGAYNLRVHDTNADQSWSVDLYGYDGTGALSFRSLQYDSGARLYIDYDQTNTNGWSQISENYDISARLTNLVTTLDSGALFSTFYDVAGVQNWASSTSGKDAAGNNDYLDTRYDDGTRIFTDYDQAGSQPWITALSFYNADGDRTARRVNLDDGRTEVTYDDFSDSEVWTSKIDSYRDGLRDFVNDYNDDGTRKTTDFDQLSSEEWTIKEVFYNSANQSQYINTAYDDGTRIFKTFDPLNGHNYAEALVGYDVNGAADYISTLYDDGSRITRDYDQNDEHDWIEEVFVYDTEGVLMDNYFVF